MKNNKLRDGWQFIEVDKLVLADWNYKDNDEELQQKLKNNIEENGQLETIIVRELPDGFYEVVNGNHRLVVFKELEFKEVLCRNVGVISLEHAKLIALATNETKFKANDQKLNATLKDIGVKFTGIQMEKFLPWTEKEITDRKASVDFTFDIFGTKEEKKGTSESSGSSTPLPNENEYKTITLKLELHVAEQLEAQLDRFKKALFPEEFPDDVLPTIPVQAMVEHLARIPDDKLK